jgi:hypothetical protein
MDQVGRWSLAFNGHVEGIQSDLGMQCLTHGPAGDLAGVYVEDGGQVEPAFTGRDLGQVGEPDLVGSRRFEVSGNRLGAGSSIDGAPSRAAPALWPLRSPTGRCWRPDQPPPA